jgi:hypothetical protein
VVVHTCDSSTWGAKAGKSRALLQTTGTDLPLLNWVPKNRTARKLLVFCFELASHHVAQADLKLTILPPRSPECWDYRCVPMSSLESLIKAFDFT